MIPAPQVDYEHVSDPHLKMSGAERLGGWTQGFLKSCVVTRKFLGWQKSCCKYNSAPFSSRRKMSPLGVYEEVTWLRQLPPGPDHMSPPSRATRNIGYEFRAINTSLQL